MEWYNSSLIFNIFGLFRSLFTGLLILNYIIVCFLIHPNDFIFEHVKIYVPISLNPIEDLCCNMIESEKYFKIIQWSCKKNCVTWFYQFSYDYILMYVREIKIITYIHLHNGFHSRFILQHGSKWRFLWQ